MASKRTGASAQPKTTSSAPMTPTPPSPPIAITLKDLQEALAKSTVQTVEQVRAETEQLLKKNKEEIVGDFTQIFQKFADHVNDIEEKVGEVAVKMEGVQEKMEQIDDEMDNVGNDVVMIQYREMEFALRIRGMKENPKEDLKADISVAVAAALECSPIAMLEEIEKAYRVNSWVARQRNLPRDVVVYFARRNRRNQIIQAFYKQKFPIASQDIILLKEIPPKILRQRKDFAFLVQELKKRQISFRWDIPIGMVLNYGGVRYRLNTVQKAEDFYLSTLKAEPPREQDARGAEKQIDQLLVDIPGIATEQNIQQQAEKRDDPREQRMTRAAHKRQEKEQLQKALATYLPAEPVGGAKPKQSMKSDWQDLLDKLQKPKDG